MSILFLNKRIPALRSSWVKHTLLTRIITH